MSEKTATVQWQGGGKLGQGKITTETGALKQYPYGFASRFEDDRRGSNPEELLAAAHAACFTMAFSFACDKAGLATTEIDTVASVRLSQQGEGFAIDRIALTLRALGTGDRPSHLPGHRRQSQARMPIIESAGRRRRDHLAGDSRLVVPSWIGSGKTAP